MGAKAASIAARGFQGRLPEIARFVDLLSHPSDLLRCVCLTGPPGIGKTALIRAVKRRVEADRLADVVVIDACEFDGDPVTFEHLVRTRAALWPRKPGDLPLLVVIDSYERVGTHDRRRLRETFMSSVTGPVILALCERQLPRDVLIQSAGWRSITDEIPLHPLSREDSVGLLCAQGVDGTAAREIATLTGGNPLLIAGAGVVDASPTHREIRIAREATRLLFTRLRSENVNDATRTLIETVALFPCLNEEALEAAAGPALREHIGQFRAVSIVNECAAGYWIAEPFRSLLALDLRSRRPHWCAVTEAAVVASASETGSAVVESARVRESDPMRQPSVSAELLIIAKQALEWLRKDCLSDGCPLPAIGLLWPLDTAELVRARLTGIINGLCVSRSPRVAEAGLLLSSYHLNGSPSIEAVADRMNVSRATIFRRLHLGIALVAERLAELADTVETAALLPVRPEIGSPCALCRLADKQCNRPQAAGSPSVGAATSW